MTIAMLVWAGVCFVFAVGVVVCYELERWRLDCEHNERVEQQTEQQMQQVSLAAQAALREVNRAVEYGALRYRCDDRQAMTKQPYLQDRA